jgi:hypothetical protein
MGSHAASTDASSFGRPVMLLAKNLKAPSLQTAKITALHGVVNVLTVPFLLNPGLQRYLIVVPSSTFFSVVSLSSTVSMSAFTMLLTEHDTGLHVLPCESGVQLERQTALYVRGESGRTSPDEFDALYPELHVTSSDSSNSTGGGVSLSTTPFASTGVSDLHVIFLHVGDAEKLHHPQVLE